MQPLTDEERKKLTKNLREYANELTFEGLLAHDAANEIERLVAEVQKLKDELELVRHDEERFIYD